MYMSHCTIVEDGTTPLLVSRQLNAEATPYKHTYTILVISKSLYFPEFVAIKKTAKSDRITTAATDSYGNGYTLLCLECAQRSWVA